MEGVGRAGDPTQSSSLTLHGTYSRSITLPLSPIASLPSSPIRKHAHARSAPRRRPKRHQDPPGKDVIMPHLYSAPAPTTVLKASPLEDSFVLSAAGGDVVDIERRLARGQKINVAHSSLKYTALHAAADAGQQDVVRRLVGHGAAVNIKHEESGNTPLHFAVANGHVAVADLLISLGADDQLYNAHGMRAIEVAVEFRQPALIRALARKPEKPARLRATALSPSSLRFTFRLPFADGVWVDKHELQLVALPDADLPGGNATGKPYPSAVIPPPPPEPPRTSTSTFLHGTVGPVQNITGGHCPSHTVHGLGFFTMYRARVRVHTVAGWSPYSKPVTAHTEATHPDAPSAVAITGHVLTDLSLAWQGARENGAPILGFAVQVSATKDAPEVSADHHDRAHPASPADAGWTPPPLTPLDPWVSHTSTSNPTPAGEDDVSAYDDNDPHLWKWSAYVERPAVAVVPAARRGWMLLRATLPTPARTPDSDDSDSGDGKKPAAGATPPQVWVNPALNQESSALYGGRLHSPKPSTLALTQRWPAPLQSLKPGLMTAKPPTPPPDASEFEAQRCVDSFAGHRGGDEEVISDDSGLSDDTDFATYSFSNSGAGLRARPRRLRPAPAAWGVSGNQTDKAALVAASKQRADADGNAWLASLRSATGDEPPPPLSVNPTPSPSRVATPAGDALTEPPRMAASVAAAVQAAAKAREAATPAVPPGAHLPDLPQVDGEWSLGSGKLDVDVLALTIPYLMPGRFIRVRVLAFNEHGWSTASPPSAPRWLPHVPVVTSVTETTATLRLAGAGDLGGLHLQIQRRGEDDANGAPLAWAPKPSEEAHLPGFRRVSADPSEDEPDVGTPWEDVTPERTPDGYVVQGLLPYTRYRFRCRLAGGEGSWPDWSLSGLSDWALTAVAPPMPVGDVTAVPWTLTSMLVQWKLPRINGGSITSFRLERKRLRLHDDQDSDSASDSSSSDSEAPRPASRASSAAPSSPRPMKRGGGRRSSLRRDLAASLLPRPPLRDDDHSSVASSRSKREVRHAYADLVPTLPSVSVFNTWLHEADGVPIDAARGQADHVTAQEDVVLQKVYDSKLGDREDVLHRCLGRKGFGLSVRLVRCWEVLYTSRALAPEDYEVRPEEPDAAWVVEGLRPGSHHQYRVSVANAGGWSAPSEPSPLVRLVGLGPERPPPPVCLPYNTTSVLVAWTVPRSNGAPIAKHVLQTRRTWRPDHPDTSDSEDDDAGPARGPYNGPFVNAARVARRTRTVWDTVLLPTSVTLGRRVQPPLTDAFVDTSPEGLTIANEDVVTQDQLVRLRRLLAADRPWTVAVVTGKRPTSRHVFRVSVANAVGLSKRSAPSVEVAVQRDAPLQPVPGLAQPSGPTAMMFFWIEPYDSGAPVLRNFLERQRVWDTGSQDSDSEPGENDTEEWVRLHPDVPSGTAQRTALAIEFPDVARAVGARGKRRFGKRMGYAIDGLRAGKAYRFRVAAVNTLGVSPASPPCAVTRTISMVPDAPAAVVARQHTPRTLLIAWNPPRSNGSLVNLVLAVRQPLTRQRAADILEGRWTARDDKRAAATSELETERECDALMMHPDSVSVLKAGPQGSWLPVPLSGDVSGGRGLTRRPATPAEVAALPVGPTGVTLETHRPWVEVTVDGLVPETWHRFKIRYRNQRGWSEWSPPSVPVAVFPDWPEEVSPCPELAAASPYSLLVTWMEPHGNGSIVTGYKVQARRKRFRPKDLEPHPDDSDSEPEDGHFDGVWGDVGEVSAPLALALGTQAAVGSFLAECAAAPHPDADAAWLAGMESAHGGEAEGGHGDGRVLQRCGFLIQGLRPGTRHEVRVSGRNYLGYPPFSDVSNIMKTDGVLPLTPGPPTAAPIPDQPSCLHVSFTAPRSNGSEIFAYEVWRKRARGGAAPDDSDSEPDTTSDLLNDTDFEFVQVLSTTPEESTVKQVWKTSGHSGDHMRALVEGLRPGSRHAFMVQALSFRGLSPLTPVSNTARCQPLVPLPPGRPAIYLRSSSGLHVAWTAGRSRGAAAIEFEVQRQRLKGKPDLGVPSDDEMQAVAGGAEKVRRRVDGVMAAWLLRGWETLGVFPVGDCQGIPQPLPKSEFVGPPRVRSRVKAYLDGKEAPPTAPPGITRPRYSYAQSDVLLPNSTHEFRVRTRNAVGWSEFSVASYAQRTLATVPFPPGRLYISSQPGDPVTFSWEPARSNGLKIMSYELTHLEFVDVPADLTAVTDGWSGPQVLQGDVRKLRTVLYEATVEERAMGHVVKRVYRVRCRNTAGWSKHSTLSELLVFTPESAAESDDIQAEYDKVWARLQGGEDVQEEEEGEEGKGEEEDSGGVEETKEDADDEGGLSDTSQEHPSEESARESASESDTVGTGSVAESPVGDDLDALGL